MTEQHSNDTTDLSEYGSPLADDEELVADPAFVATLQKRRLTTPATRVLLILIILGLGFLLGAYVQKQRTPSTNTALPAGLAQLFARNGGTPTGFGGSAGGLTGTVKLVDGNNIYISDAQGNVTKIITNANTTIKVNKPGTLADLGPSKTVTVQGSQNKDGTYSATSIQESSGGGGSVPGGGGAGSSTGTGGSGGLPSGPPTGGSG